MTNEAGAKADPMNEFWIGIANETNISYNEARRTLNRFRHIQDSIKSDKDRPTVMDLSGNSLQVFNTAQLIFLVYGQYSLMKCALRAPKPVSKRELLLRIEAHRMLIMELHTKLGHRTPAYEKIVQELVDLHMAEQKATPDQQPPPDERH